MAQQSLTPTPGQTVGPFFGYALPFAGGNELVPPHSPRAITLTGQVFDGNGDPVPDALVEVWQADANGHVVRRPGSLHRDGHTFTGWGRCPVDNTGRYRFHTVLPGATEEGSAPFFAITIFARGLLNRLFTRAYLPGADETDPLLASLDQDRRASLICGEQDGQLTFDIWLQGDHETVFLTYPGQDDMMGQ